MAAMGSIRTRLWAWARELRSSLSGFTSLTNPAAWLVEAFGGSRSSSGVVVTPETAMRTSAVYGCARILSASMAALPFRLYRRLPDGGRERATRHPLYPLLAQLPNPYETAYDSIERAMVSILLRGNAYWRIVRASSGAIQQLVQLHPDSVEIVSVGGVPTYRLRVEGGFETLLPGEVWHVRGLSLDGFRGCSVIEYARESIGAGIAAERHAGSFFENGARPSGVLQHPGELSEAAKSAIEKTWREKYAAGGLAVLEEGMKYEPIAMTNEDAQFLESRQFQVEDIARFFGVPLHMLGVKGAASFASAEQQGIDFVTYTLLPWMVRFSQSVYRDLLLVSEREELFAEHDYNAFLRGDALTRFNAYGIGRNWGWLSANDVRRAENLSPIENGNVYMQPVNMAPLGQSPGSPQPQRGAP